MYIQIVRNEKDLMPSYLILRLFIIMLNKRNSLTQMLHLTKWASSHSSVLREVACENKTTTISTEV
ncbi:hypothetical protein T4D_14264 [Trichinella pseudospiralis]|uniref:Uncharacterized protein n=1 Tax=Trichinella pseudospiralis TaxID=6337 RepID=A0A0V1FAV7_TRIPS|nr:hypothetical protein T4D_14264 [Trichinella pseudospiralis]